ncbi:hypothetical protein AQUSIP_18010 [Aquicella siphonis]|uniref:Glycosyltransferase 2-like domain-containing protein n=1 Tax=Aquicella siphonis TaxID=254247 RepID=A0A5E4PJ57_9COXI|nr:hypothetical protein [Aquicella siphonis]VVC76488.1 hypothetical protein AQUSIP_18010 [Aquicella siphonis]
MSTDSTPKVWNTITVKNEAYVYDERYPLVSIHLASNRPDQFTQLVENVHSTVTNKNAYEIIVKIDTEDARMIECVKQLADTYGTDRIKALIGPRKDGPWSTWEFYNAMFHMTHEKVYFMWNPSDEVRFVTPGWDKILQKYIGFYQDNIFRLKLSDNRLRNFYQFHEVLGSPDNFPFMTKKWMDLCGLWGDCHSPDLFHQAVSYYLGLDNIFRDIPIFDIELGGIEAGLLIPPEKMYSRTQNIRRLWLIALSKQMRSRYMAHAKKIRFFIQSCEKGAHVVTIKETARYPSTVVCSNDIGMRETVKCLIRGKIVYGMRLMARYTLSKMYGALKKFFNMPVSVTFSPLTLTFLLIANLLLISDTHSTIVRLISLLTIYLIIWLMGKTHKRIKAAQNLK